MKMISPCFLPSLILILGQGIEFANAATILHTLYRVPLIYLGTPTKSADPMYTTIISKLGPGENGATRYLEIDVYPSLSMVTLPQTTETFTVPATGSFEFQEAASHYQAIIHGTTYSTIQPTRSGEPVSYEAISNINLNCDLNIQENTGQCVIDGVDSGSMIVETWTGELVPYATITAIESAGRRRVHGADGYVYALPVLLCTIGTLVGSALVIS
ncbi:hypothetical protein D9613_007933 [Agrocybe pediades]|uniref:Uncharacterized protein n=1 Tax=Agrocybe pediades TaxID=84607 RepID=A0A8H4QMH1_9AGAR|nr:hypothetical protein D9613_007933 [Agrocybe pediades]